MTLEECYQILEVSRGASLPEVEESYRRLVRVWHPDRFNNDPSLRQAAEAKLTRINVAMDEVRAHAQKGSAPNTNEAGPADQLLAHRDRVFLRGGDPRFASFSQLELQSGGRPAIVEVTPAGVVITTLRNNAVHEVVAYHPKYICDVRHVDQSPDLAIIAMDPEGISRNAFEVVLSFRTWYYGSLFHKRFREYVKIPQPAEQPASAPQRTGKSPSILNERLVIEVCTLTLAAIALIALFVAILNAFMVMLNEFA